MKWYILLKFLLNGNFLKIAPLDEYTLKQILVL